jgi:site-specific recombinase XerC
MTITAPTEKEKIEWNVKNAGLLVGEECFLKGDYINEPPLYISTSIRFSDNKWDFSDEIHENVVINFSLIKSKIFRVLSKKYAIRQMFFIGNRSVTVKKKCMDINGFIRFLEKEKYMYELDYLTPEIIEEYIEGLKKKGRKMSTLSEKLSAIGDFLMEVEIGGHDIDLSHYQKILNSIPWEERKAELEANKTPNIPKRIFNKVVQAALKDMDDEKLTIEDRMMACLIVILSHTGMRQGELRILESNKLRDITILNKEEKAYILEFFTYKTTGRKEGRWTKSIAFPNTLKAYRTLEKLSEDRRIIGNTNYLYCNKKGIKYSLTNFTNRFDIFFYRHQEIFNDLKEYESTQVHCQSLRANLIQYLGKKRFPNIFIGEKYFTLNPHQFRVCIANILKGKVSLQWIREHMNHLDEEMTKHYFRDDELVKETLYKRATSDGNSLGIDSDSQNNLIKNELSEPELQKAYEEINKFLKKKKFNIFKDIDAIMNTLIYNPLRESIVGVCTKHMGILCERQYRLAALEKWYYISPTLPNIESFDFTYKRFLDKAKIVQHNKQLAQMDPKKYQLEYDNEYLALKKFYQNRLLPEYELVLFKLKEEGEETILSSFPQLEGIISDIEGICKEISKWTTTLTLKNT